MSALKTFRAEYAGQTLIVVPLVSVSGLAEKEVRLQFDHLRERVQRSGLRNVVIDFAEISYFGTTMLEAMHGLWKYVRQSGGKMALCNVSSMQREVLHVAGFDALWPIFSSREEALQAIGP